MYERFTDRARRVLVLARVEALRLGDNYVSTQHILVGLVREEGGVASAVLSSLGILLDDVREGEQVHLPTDSYPPFTPQSKKVFEMALREASRFGLDYIGTEHLLLGIIREDNGVGAEILKRHTSLTTVRRMVEEVLSERKVTPSANISKLVVKALRAKAGTTRLLVKVNTPIDPEKLQELLRISLA